MIVWSNICYSCGSSNLIILYHFKFFFFFSKKKIQNFGVNCIQVFRCSILDMLIKFKHVVALNLIVFEKYNSVCALLIIATMCLNLVWLDYLKGRHLRNCTWVLAFVFFYVNLFIVLIEFRFVIWFQFDVVFIVKNWEYLRHCIV